MNGQIKITTIKPLWKTRLGQTVCFSPSGKLLAVGGARGPVQLLDAQTGKLVVVCEGSKSNIYRIAFSQDRNLVAIGEFDKRVSVCDATTGKCVGKLQAGDAEINSLEFNPKTKHLIRAARKSEIDIFETTHFKACKTLKPDPAVHTVMAALFSADGEKLFAAWNTNSAEQGVSLAFFSWPGRERLVKTSLDVELIYDSALSDEGRFVALAISSYDPPQVGIAILDANDCTLMRTVLTRETSAVGFVPSKSLLIASDAEGDIEYCRLIDPTSGNEMGRFEVGNHRIFEFSISPDARYLAAATSGGARVWDLNSVH